MKVLKFGGTSVGSAKNIQKVIEIVKNISQDSNVAVVVSAVGGITDKLLNAANKAVAKDTTYNEVFNQVKLIHLDIIDELIKTEINSEVKENINSKLNSLEKLLEGIYLINELSPKTTDKLLSNGEQMSSYIISEAMKLNGIDVQLKSSQELIVTDNNYTNATVNFNQTNNNVKSYFETNNTSVTLLPGFISKSENGEITTLGRGGSDFTAAIIAAAIEAEELQIWTDVSGMFTTNPKLVKQAKPISHISYQEAVELSHFGAKVLYPPTVQPVLNKKIPIVIKNTLKPEDSGTYITDSNSNGNTNAVKGISNINDIALLTLQGNGMVGIPGFSKRLFETLSQEKINVVLITQASSEHSICIGIQETDADAAKMAIDKTFENEISLHKIDPIIVEKELAIIAVVGDSMKNHQGISGRMFSTLGKNNVNIRAIAQGASERNISAVISKKDVKKALNVVHERFFETKTKQLNLFITGVGNVGERLVEQIKQQKKYIKEHLKLNLRIVGLSNSRKMILDDDGIDLNNWKSLLENGENASINGFFNAAKTMNLRNSVFVDVTANYDVANNYANYLRESIGVIACNKIACSSELDNYNLLKRLSRKYNAPFLFETNVGAGLPVIDTLNHLITSGDEIKSIQAVLSGSLNFVFNNFNDKTKFHDVVKLAQKEGYTEPDPRIDLSGVDVARKILILARESGTEMNLENILNEPFLSKSGLESKSVDDFYQTLLDDEVHYQNLYQSANKNNCQLKYVAEFNNGKAKVGLKEIPEGHPFYNLEGKDNIVMFYTKRYPEQPLIVKGAGAGAEVTASGLFADIIRIANN
ncbi:bifunctional aspartate kinase/homoserine dehydrogenase I [Flavobacteriaceae bacterium S0825]|uniref:bifunctional aspartate kinase/homoserine dehydrogenase I n=1 Tax=Gaetbulibacter sp. S0825 TaxID=2720084 RepID=UPI00142F4AC7|nr:bifunctional aspartate kinase/homoserine dehydrogenase I [Gaetbulibacter sp. S0825]MCK0110520.1 bifunctional aspartate kinase/homoserine dehydrogenase I [Flavobacteriaceae bacterium S0825]NIX66149.1 bifunctional aspartate kinase/homoserine dehydrogenase I [Gaetbulibacter sp. S0825]